MAFSFIIRLYFKIIFLFSICMSELDRLKTLLKDHGIWAKKRLGQNFLVDKKVFRKPLKKVFGLSKIAVKIILRASLSFASFSWGPQDPLQLLATRAQFKIILNFNLR